MISKKIRILFTISNFNTAGSGKVIYDLVQGLDKDIFEVEIACQSKSGAFFKTIEALGVPIHIVATKTSYKPYYNLLFRIFSVSKFLKRQKYDIIHSWQWSSDWTEVLAAKLSGIKWMYTKKAMGFESRHWRIKSYLSDFIVTINNDMQKYFPNKKAQALIPLGIDTEYYSSEHFKKESGSPDSRFRIITVANLVPVKGIEVLIQALFEIQDKRFELTILGDHNNAYGKEMIALVKKLGMDDQVQFAGKQLDVRPYIVNSNLYVIPTVGKGEGMPMALVEAMCMEIPVLGSNISGVNFVLKEFPNLLFEAGNIEALANKIKYISDLNEASKVALGKSLRTYCETHFFMNKFIKTHQELYKRIVKFN